MQDKVDGAASGSNVGVDLGPDGLAGPGNASPSASESTAAGREEAEAGKERSGLAEFFRDAWEQALLKVGVAEDEAAKVLHRAGDLAGWKPDDVKRLAKEFSERLALQRREFEKSLDEGIHRAVSRVRLPRRDELDSLMSRLDQVEARIETLRQKRIQ